jgi:ankyrin repeat protein
MFAPEEIDGRIAAFLATKNEQSILDLLSEGVIKPDQEFKTSGVKNRLLAVAAAENLSRLALYLVAKGVNVNRVTHGCTPLTDACEWGNLALIEALLAANADVNLRRKATSGETDDTPLIISAGQCDLHAVSRLLESGADVNAVNRHDRTALHCVIQCEVNRPGRPPNLQPIVERLLKSEAKILGTELTLAAYRRDTEIAKLLLDNGSPLNVRIPKKSGDGPIKGDTPLLAVCRMNARDLAGGHFGYEISDEARITLVRLFLKHGADPNQPDAKGKSPLQMLVPRDAGRVESRLADLLIAAGASEPTAQLPPGSIPTRDTPCRNLKKQLLPSS